MKAASHHHQSGTRALLVALLAAAGLLLGSFSGASAQTDEWAQELEKGKPEETTSPSESSDGDAPDRAEAPDKSDAAHAGERASVTLSQEPYHYVAPLIDTKYSVGPAEFLGIDMPSDPPGAKAVRLIGTIEVEGQGDIQVRLFRHADYQNWLKKRGGRKAEPYWTSKKLRKITMDHPLTQGSPVVLVIDNGYSVRTPKKVKTLLQIQYERTGAVPAATTASSTNKPAEDDFIVPRSDTEEVIPPPPPPPPSE
ncbi:MAG TPA: hypothetical protein VFP58_02245 [Candidatus Eisenbacteria bacterium]|nr:hypothetical protein [Candidatus Eisenbacteria bacterium]